MKDEKKGNRPVQVRRQRFIALSVLRKLDLLAQIPKYPPPFPIRSPRSSTSLASSRHVDGDG